MTTKISQKDYLKKYLSSDKNTDKKKKKKKSKTVAGKQSVNIIDDDIDLSKLHQIADEDLEVYAIGEDAPQIVGVFDERPPELIAKEDYKNNGKWKVIADDDGFSSSLNIQHTDVNGKVSRSTGNDSIKVTRKLESKDDDLSPPRVKVEKDRNSGDMSPRRRYESTKQTKQPRLSRFTDASPKQQRRRSSSDHSPPRKNVTNSPYRRPRHNSIDESPPRRKKMKEESLDRQTLTPPRKVKQEPDSDASPPRRRRSPKSRKHSSDQSPPRKLKSNSDLSPPRRKTIKQEPDSDASPPRRRHSRSPKRRQSPSPRRSPYRRGYSSSHRDSSSSKLRRDRRSSRSPHNRNKHSPPRRRTDTSPKMSPSHRRRSLNSPTEEINEKMKKTLDGKTAGLQNAKALRVENDKFKKREEEMFNKMTSDMSGRHAEAVVRDRNTGRIRDLGEEAAKEHEKLLKEQERKAVYDKWGKGLKQVEDYRSRLEDDLHETNKPLARYSDDKDLEEMLKKQERDGDPMLNYIRNKMDSRADATPSKPIYRGVYPENRFSIRPGYRWDGVDRSNGYETKWFDVQSKRKAGEEEAYKYSTEDM